MKRHNSGRKLVISSAGRAVAVTVGWLVVVQLAVVFALYGVWSAPGQVQVALALTLPVAIVMPLLYGTVLRPLRYSEARLRAIVGAAGDGIIVIGSTGIIESFNPAAEAMFGRPADDVLGHNVSELMPSPFHEEHDAYLANYGESGEWHVIGRRHETVGRRSDGSTFPVELAVSEFDIGGDVKFTGIVRDITERKQAEQRFQTLSERSPIGIYIVQDDAFQYVNPRFVELTGFEIGELLGTRPLDLVVPEDRDTVRESAVRMLQSGRAGEYEYRLRNKAGDVRTIIESVVSLEYEGRRAAYGYFIDITDRKRAEEAVRFSEERYRSTFQQLQDVLFKTDEHGTFTMVSPSVQRLLGYAPEELIGANARTLCADAAEVEALHERVFAGKTVEDYEATCVRKDGSEVVVSVSAALIFGEGPDRISVQGTLHDISARKLAEEERDRYFEMSIDPLAVTDMEMRFRRVNPAWERVLGYTREEMLGHTPLRFSVPEDRPAVVAAALETADGHALEDRRTRYLTRGGEIRWLSWNTTPVINGLSYSVVRDVTEQVRVQDEQIQMVAQLEANARALTEQALELDALRDKAEYAANHDMLTGLLNRRAWFATAVADRGTAVALIDIDNFKRINDTWGHPAGDAVLVEISNRLKSSLACASVGRVGGEEFAVLFHGPVADASGACNAALAAVGGAPVRLSCGQEIVVTLSVGLAPWRRGQITREDALARTYEAADHALYAAKEGGRARLVVSGDGLKAA